MFDAFHYCDYDSLNIVILGQDPYPQEGVATGLAFANTFMFPDSIEVPLSPSLKVIEDSLLDGENNCTFDPTLISWAKQGVLLLNTSLTTEVGKIGAHTMLWSKFMVSFLKELSERNPAMIYILLGRQAMSFAKYLGDFSHIYADNHPAYYAREHKAMPRRVFDEANDTLFKLNGIKIKWYESLQS